MHMAKNEPGIINPPKYHCYDDTVDIVAVQQG